MITTIKIERVVVSLACNLFFLLQIPVNYSYNTGIQTSIVLHKGKSKERIEVI
jgi:hypothetical protein